MFINHPLAMVHDREMQTETLVRDAAAHRRALDALRRRGKPVESQPTPPANAAEADAEASGAPRRMPPSPAWEPAGGGG